MITIPVEDWVFAVSALVGGVLLLITVVFDDIVGGLLDGFGFDVGGTTITPILLGFIGMFGAGGLFATQVLDVHGGQAAIVGVVAGIGGAALAGGLFSVLKRSESEEPFKLDDLVGGSAYVSVGIPASRFGSVLVKAEGQTHEFAATADADVPAGRTVTVVGVAGNAVIVRDEPRPPAPAPAPAPAQAPTTTAASTATTDGASTPEHDTED
jgi:membrane protein implicated in regulation of membrane protease activity